ncbi:hypothetical protein SJAV_15780 [Sulfurisphaera javensis]|uniref:DUF1404 domain-containing protein n=1 Tax=Sulfurisphaera javensis TaxID=2049879 RepID=A0AAT9GRU4_9CREN
MNYLVLAKYTSIVILLVSVIVYVFGDPITKLLSYQGPVLGGGVLGWYTLNSASKDKYVEDEQGERVPVVSIAIRKYAILSFVLSLALVIPWLTPLMFKIEEENQILFAGSFISMAIAGFIMGYFISSFKFIEKVLIYSLGFVADILYFFIVYDAANLFGIPETIIVNYILLLVFGLKFPEGILFGLYIVKKVKAI